MAVVSYLYRRGARYYYRRRLHLRNLISRPITIALGTADPVEARRLGARLSVRWDQMMMTLGTATRGYMTASEATTIFKRGLDEELGLATAHLTDRGGGDQRTSRVMEAAYRIAARLDPDAETMTADVLEAHTVSFSDEDKHAVVLMLKALAPQRAARTDAAAMLAAINAPVTGTTIRDARIQLLLARAEAQARAGLLDDPTLAATGNPAARLLDDDFVTRVRNGPSPVSPQETNNTPYLTLDTRRFNEVIDATIASIQVSGDWNEDIAQRKRVVQGFGWTTGNKQLCDYVPDDAQHFARTLLKLPTEFRWGTPQAGNMSRPFDEVMAEVAVTEGTARSSRTLNRDLTTMSRFARELMKTAWKPRYGKDPVVDFNAFTAASPQDDPNDPDRMPWTEEQLTTLFSSPVYTGGGRCARRLKADLLGSVWHDAAYWVPLLLTYAILTREEACGLECLDFVFDVATPFLAVKANMTKSKDGKKPAGLKRPSRYRMVPLHPELLRLGIREYVSAMEAAGHRMIFPELYQDGQIKRGGVRFYASAGRYLLDYVDSSLGLLRTSAGKRADLHSMRTSGGSALEHSNAKQLLVDDILGHAREGTGPRKYSKAWFAKGREKILAKRLKAMMKAIPNVTKHLHPEPVRMLALAERSRTGSASGCASRKKA